MNDKKPILSRHFHETLIKTAIIDEMARSDNWQSLDECLEIKPGVVKNPARYADAALRAIKRLEDEGQYPQPN